MPRDDGLWSSRYQQGGGVRIERRLPTEPPRGAAAGLEAAGRRWRGLPSWSQWLLGVGVFLGLQTVAAPTGVLFAVLLVVFLGATGEAATQARRASLATPEAELAAADGTEGRVATASDAG